MTVEYDADEAPRRGQPVSHPQFGLGRLVRLSSGGSPIATVQFASGQRKDIALRFLKLLGRDDGGDFGDLEGQ